MKVSSLWKSAALVCAAALTLGISACSDDPAAPDPNAGIKSPVTMLNVNPGLAVPVNFALGSDNIATSIAYGVPTVVQVQIGQQTIAVKSTSGSALASTGVQIDSSRPVWVIHAGDVSPAEAIGVDAPKNLAAIATALTSGNALIRFIHASKNAGNASLRLGTEFGTKVADNIAYKSASEFTLVDTTTKSLVLTKGSTGNDTVAVSPIQTGQLVAGKLYTVVLYGSSDASAAAEQKLMARIVAEP